MQVLDELKRQMLLEGLDDSELQSIAQVVELMKVSKGDPIFRENEPTRGVYMIKSGEIEVTKKLPIDLKTKMLITVRNTQNCCEIRKTPYGWRQVFATLLDGQFFGELSVIEGKKKHGADADALDDTELYLIRSEKFAEIEVSSPATMLKILRVIARVSSKNMRYLDKQLLRLLIGI
ncbi:Crp/Fnr family transcriptional regulator [Candidatus Magnetominusculus xianensis]|uniref:Transcriptional regulator n=1 Tax=Candidatus Magnetominusculus xianensis TaxID=1748249 RepID=A0ABR5SGK4_9BACT|nr:cyclic nucleotide-binding domain-containing protein [Candidatus Magnetominusculus xianensis]KWT85930.1 transcriptional regulator [Candidatus Magnetominusculus xianensis]MBF0403603.1 cyclic nucleotide-binding domain-containing protein [Nitrospirota bacterium]